VLSASDHGRESPFQAIRRPGWTSIRSRGGFERRYPPWLVNGLWSARWWQSAQESGRGAPCGRVTQICESLAQAVRGLFRGTGSLDLELLLRVGGRVDRVGQSLHLRLFQNGRPNDYNAEPRTEHTEVPESSDTGLAKECSDRWRGHRTSTDELGERI